jgi:hypothetical protein
MLHLVLILGWISLSACIALGVAIMSDRLLGTFSASQPAPVRVSPGDRRHQPEQKEKTDV